jgi:hypothetical protein
MICFDVDIIKRDKILLIFYLFLIYIRIFKKPSVKAIRLVKILSFFNFKMVSIIKFKSF